MKPDSPNLDLLRAYAVILVIISHLKHELGWGDWNTRALGFCGVALFFVHTTLVLMMSLERHGSDALSFFVRRAFRIYPLAMVSVLLMALMMRAGGAPLSVGAIASNLLLVQHVTGHASSPPQLWTLPYELQMYLVLPAIYTFTRVARPLLRTALLYLLGLAPPAALVAISRNWTMPLDTTGSMLVYATGIAFVPCFLPGVMAFLLANRVRPSFNPLVLGAVVVGGPIAISAVLPDGEVSPPLLWALCLAVGLTIPFCREVSFKPLATLGSFIAKYSYSIYLTHLVVIVFTLAQPGPWYVRVPQFIVMQLAVSILFYRTIEAPCIRIGMRLSALVRNRRQDRTTPFHAPEM
jgi:peptidoglycan/LPS O-acetylase OafA/YrhL